MASAIAAAAADLAFRLAFLPKRLAVPVEVFEGGWLGASNISFLVTVRANDLRVGMVTDEKPSTADMTRASEKIRQKALNLIVGACLALAEVKI